MTGGQVLVGLGLVGAGLFIVGKGNVAAAQALTPVDADKAADVGEKQDNISGIVEVAGEVGKGTAGDAVYGGDPVGGMKCESALPVTYAGPSGEPGIVVDNTASTGGADPSTQAPTPSMAVQAERPGGANNGLWAGRGDVEDMMYEAWWGKAGRKGTTRQERDRVYGEAGMLGGEVW